MIRRKALPASANASPGNQVGSAYSLSQSHQLISGQRQHTKHQVSHHLGFTLDHDGVAAELVLEPSISALGGGALVVPQGDFLRGVVNGFGGENSIFVPRRGLWSIRGTWPGLRLCSRNSALQ